MKVLVVEDDELTANALREILSQQNYAVEVATDGQIGLELAEAFPYDLMLLDVVLPRLDGISLCRQLRSQGYQTPILLLTGRDNGHDKALGLDAGADDYVVKPFDVEELVARIRALLRRGGPMSQPVLEWDRLRLDPTSHEVTWGNQFLSLTAKEFALLELFLRNSRRVFSCSLILEHLWSYEDTPGEEAVRTHIKGLRQKLKAAGAPNDLVETVYGAGYRLKPLKPQETAPQPQHKSKRHPQLQTVDVPANSAHQQTLESLNQIWHQFKHRVSQQVEVLEQAATRLGGQLGEQSLSLKLRQQAQQEAHTLAGALGTFGLTRGSEIARQIEAQLQADSALDAQGTLQLQEQVTALRQQIEQFSGPTAGEWSSSLSANKAPSVEQQPLLLIVDRDRPLAEQLAQAATQRNLRAVIASDLAAAKAQIDLEQPHAILLDPTVAPDSDNRWQGLLDLSQQAPAVPVLVFTAQDLLRDRLKVARLGGRAFLHKPMPAAQVLEAIVQVLQPTRSPETKVMVVDDDPQILAVLRIFLEPLGLAVTTLDDPRQFWEVLAATSPDLLILDVKMPYLSGIELCQVVRNDPHWAGLPILFLTAYADAATVNQVFTVGADDFVSKPIVAAELMTRVQNRLDRIKLLKQAGEAHARPRQA